MNPSYCRIRVPQAAALERFAAWQQLLRVGPLVPADSVQAGGAELDAAALVPELTRSVAIARAAATLAAAGGTTIVTNLSLYRAYLEHFLAAHPLLDRSRPIVVRQNEPGGTGILVDVLCFYLDSELKEYETIQSSMLDHFAAVTAVFGLRIYQQGSDIAAVREPFPFLPENETRLLNTPA